jgi:hypothetical protein
MIEAPCEETSNYPENAAPAKRNKTTIKLGIFI